MATQYLGREIVPDDVARSVILPGSYADLDGTVHPACKWLRENMLVAVAHVEDYDPVWLISKHAAIKAVFGDADLFHNADINILLYPTAGDDGLRKLNNGTTNPRCSAPVVLRRRGPHEIPEGNCPRLHAGGLRQFDERLKALANEHVDRFLEHDGEVDFVEALTRDFALAAVMELAGIPPEDYMYMLKLTQETFGGDDPDWRRDDVPATPEAAARQWHDSV